MPIISVKTPSDQVSPVEEKPVSPPRAREVHMMNTVTVIDQPTDEHDGSEPDRDDVSRNINIGAVP